MTSLLDASKNGQIPLVTELLESDAEVEAKDWVRQTRWLFRESGCVAVEGGLLRWPGYMYPSQWPGRVLHLTLASSLALRVGGGLDASGVFGGGVVVTLPFCAEI